MIDTILKRIRRLRDMTQSELAAELGLSQPYIARLESGDSNITIKTLSEIAEKLGYVLKVEFQEPELADLIIAVKDKDHANALWRTAYEAQAAVFEGNEEILPTIDYCDESVYIINYMLALRDRGEEPETILNTDTFRIAGNN